VATRKRDSFAQGCVRGAVRRRAHQLIALKELMGHAWIETTLVYLRRKDKARAMETVRSLSWGRFVFPPSEEAAYRKASKYRGFLEEAHTGFEPVLPP
jgi:hypothetical protein